jgi:hypothetical protein
MTVHQVGLGINAGHHRWNSLDRREVMVHREGKRGAAATQIDDLNRGGSKRLDFPGLVHQPQELVDLAKLALLVGANSAVGRGYPDCLEKWRGIFVAQYAQLGAVMGQIDGNSLFESSVLMDDGAAFLAKLDARIGFLSRSLDAFKRMRH